MVITQMQKDLLNTNNDVIILANGRTSGQTTALFYKSLQQKSTQFYTLAPYHKTSHFERFLNKLGLENKMEVSCSGGYKQYKVQTGNGCVVEVYFTANVVLYSNAEQTIIDDVALFHKGEVKSILAHSRSNIIVSAQPLDCGWRNPDMLNGLIDFDENDMMVSKETSWDYGLVNWKEFSTNTRASLDDYKKSVSIITGYENIERLYDPYLSNLSFNEKLRVKGDLVKGVNIE
jgi:hypothetical protein